MKTKSSFVDSNVLIYAYSSNEAKKRTIALELLSRNVIFSTQVVNELVWVLSRKFQVKYPELLSIVKYLSNNFEILTISPLTIERALGIQSDHLLSYWDALMIASAIEGRCDFFFSEDMHNGLVIDKHLKISNPFKKE